MRVPTSCLKRIDTALVLVEKYMNVENILFGGYGRQCESLYALRARARKADADDEMVEL